MLYGVKIRLKHILDLEMVDREHIEASVRLVLLLVSTLIWL